MAGWWSMARRRGADDLGLSRALGDRTLLGVVAAMTFLAALAVAGSVGASALAQRWQGGAGAVLTVQVPRPSTPAADAAGVTRLDRVVAILGGTPGIASARPLDEAELSDLLRPWLGSGTGRLSLPLPAVIDVRLAGAGPDLAVLATRLETAAPGTTPESHGVWVRRLAALARSLEACAWLALALVAGIAAAVIGVATRAGLAQRRDAIEIVHGLGATDSYIAGRFAARTTRLAAIGAGCGAVTALPVFLVLADLAAPFAPGARPAGPAAGDPVLAWLGVLPVPLWIALLALPAAAALIGYATTRATVGSWLRQLP
jgi:cell division transport system permease protein